MRMSEAKKLFFSLTETYFENATVIFTMQNRIAKPNNPLVKLQFGDVKRPFAPNCETVDGANVGYYQSRLPVTVDLFTNGAEVTDETTGKVIGMEDTALEDMLAFADFLNSEHTVAWCHEHDVSILIDGDVRNMTGAVHDANYEFRARMTVGFYFTQRAVGSSAVLSEKSVLYPTGEIDPETGEPIYSTAVPKEKTSNTGKEDASKALERRAIISPVFEETSSGGGSEELADEETGYFNNAEI